MLSYLLPLVVALDLSDEWTPRPLQPGPDGNAPAYRQTYIDLANGRLGEGPEALRPLHDRHLELYGIPPTFSVLLVRLRDEPRHRCHDAVDDDALSRLTEVVKPNQRAAAQKVRIAEAERLALRLDKLKNPAAAQKRIEATRLRTEAIRAVQAHLRCERSLTAEPDGIYAGQSQYALGVYQRLHMLTSKGHLDEETRTALLEDSRELDFRAVLRVLRERVADAAGLIEDGSAAGHEHRVLGRDLDVARLRPPESRPPPPNPAPDLIGEATEAAARALGWTSPEAVIAWFEAHPDLKRVEVPLPEPPPWHRAPVALRVEIDRGDVYTAWPYDERGKRLQFHVPRRPVLTLFARGADGGPEVALVRWPTTIGGWQLERLKSGRLARVYKESPVGKRVWRRLIVAPAWIPPDTTPLKELVRKQPDGWVIDAETMGPGYASAYGMIMLVNETMWAPRGRAPSFGDDGVRTHGSVSYGSIGRGESHGCHRLFNHLALRLGGFLLAHQPHERLGAWETTYAVRFRWAGKRMEHVFPDRGYEFRLTPPIPVEVLPGRVHKTLPVRRSVPVAGRKA